mmetsp:Transcript_26583/g.48074  ORF Transcript_26583/g.48074 Transcript_26583/m.48074 type:complete len:127 (+) Transcript_26583:2352-2732(+)
MRSCLRDAILPVTMENLVASSFSICWIHDQVCTLACPLFKNVLESERRGVETCFDAGCGCRSAPTARMWKGSSRLVALFHGSCTFKTCSVNKERMNAHAIKGMRREEFVFMLVVGALKKRLIDSLP